MSWICPQCLLTNVNANTNCADLTCHSARSFAIKENDSFDILLRETQKFRNYKENDINVYEYKNYWNKRDNPMTPAEQLFADFFSKHAVLVKDMSLLELRAYREQLSLIAKEAKAGIYASDEKEKELIKKHSDGKPTGFSRSVNDDETATAAINAVKDRQKRLTKKEKLLEGLMKLGYSAADAEKKLTAGTLLGQFGKTAEEKAKQIQENKSNNNNNNNNVTSQIEETEKKSIFNPFAK